MLLEFGPMAGTGILASSCICPLYIVFSSFYVQCTAHVHGAINEARAVCSEFLTHETTCLSEMLEKTTYENFCQKRPPTSGGTPGQATRGTCRLGQGRQAPAAVAVAGMRPW
jgi:hypothetical protein